jgi:hypothetical protein
MVKEFFTKVYPKKFKIESFKNKENDKTDVEIDEKIKRSVKDYREIDIKTYRLKYMTNSTERWEELNRVKVF